jgi:cyclin T
MSALYAFPISLLLFILLYLQVIATACLFLAGKVEETPKALRDVVKTALFIKYQDDPKRYNKLINDRIFMEQQRDVILCAERSLLHTLGFHFHAEHPYKHLLRIVKQMSEEKVIPEKNARDLAQVAWNFANDRYGLMFDNYWARLMKL